MRNKLFKLSSSIFAATVLLAGCGGGGEDEYFDYIYIDMEDEIDTTTSAPQPSSTANYFDISKTSNRYLTSNYSVPFDVYWTLDQLSTTRPLDTVSPYIVNKKSAKSTTTTKFLGKDAYSYTSTTIQLNAQQQETSRATSTIFLNPSNLAAYGAINSRGELILADTRTSAIPKYVKNGDAGYAGTNAYYSDTNKSRLLGKSYLYWFFEASGSVGTLCQTETSTPPAQVTQYKAMNASWTCKVVNTSGDLIGTVSWSKTTTGDVYYANRTGMGFL